MPGDDCAMEDDGMLRDAVPEIVTMGALEAKDGEPPLVFAADG